MRTLAFSTGNTPDMVLHVDPQLLLPLLLLSPLILCFSCISLRGRVVVIVPFSTECHTGTPPVSRMCSHCGDFRSPLALCSSALRPSSHDLQ
ncbi:hypothetical protein SRHO_G00087340 [Serrasalmus rhombeus]